MSLTEQHIVVIGGTSGIGLEVARRGLERGADVTVASSRQVSVDKALATLGGAASGQALDVNSLTAVEEFFAGVGGFDHLVYTAGEALLSMPVAELDLDAARRFFEVRYFGALSTVHAAAPNIRPGGSITLTSGTVADRPMTGLSLPASLCGAMNSLTRTLAVELAPIRVNAVAPGMVRSPLWSDVAEDDREAMYARFGASLPAGRVGEVGDAAEAYLYCMTQLWGTGAVLEINGGSLLV